MEVCQKGASGGNGIASDSFQMIGSNTSCDTIYYSFLCVTHCDKTSITLHEGETDSYKWVSEK